MNANEIKVKMDKAYEKYTKRVATTEKFRKNAEKAWTTITEKGYDKYITEDGKYTKTFYEFRDTNSNNPEKWDKVIKVYDIIDKYTTNTTNAEESKNKEEELYAVYENWTNKYNKALVTENEVENLPEIFKEVIAYLAENWTEYDKEQRKRMYEMKNNLPAYGHTKEERLKYKQAYEEFRHYFPMYRETELKRSDEEIYKANENEATLFVKDLVCRIKNKVGEITDLERIHFAGKALNGIVSGTLGSVRVETIVAGGYNIQRLHYRVLVHSI